MSTAEIAHTVLAERRPGDLVVGSPGWGSCHLAIATGDDPTVLTQMELGYAVPVALGLAWAQPDRQVIAVDGDGSLTAKLSVLADARRNGTTNLTIVVVDNNSYGTFELSGARKQLAATGWGVNVAAVARACAMTMVSEASSAQQLGVQLSTALSLPGPSLIVAHADTSVPPANAEPERMSVLVSQAMRRHLVAEGNRS